MKYAHYSLSSSFSLWMWDLQPAAANPTSNHSCELPQAVRNLEKRNLKRYPQRWITLKNCG